MGLSSWAHEKSDTFGIFNMALGIMSSIITIFVFMASYGGYITRNPIFIGLIAIAIFNFIVMLSFAHRSIFWKKERDTFETERNNALKKCAQATHEMEDCLEHHIKLVEHLGEDNIKKQQQRLLNLHQETLQTKEKILQAGITLDITTPKEVLYYEEIAWIKKHEKEKEGR